MSECVVLSHTAFTSTNSGKGEIHGFSFQTVQIVQIVSFVSEFLSFTIASFGNVIS